MRNYLEIHTGTLNNGVVFQYPDGETDLIETCENNNIDLNFFSSLSPEHECTRYFAYGEVGMLHCINLNIKKDENDDECCQCSQCNCTWDGDKASIKLIEGKSNINSMPEQILKKSKIIYDGEINFLSTDFKNIGKKRAEELERQRKDRDSENAKREERQLNFKYVNGFITNIPDYIDPSSFIGYETIRNLEFVKSVLIKNNAINGGKVDIENEDYSHVALKFYECGYNLIMYITVKRGSETKTYAVEKLMT